MLTALALNRDRLVSGYALTAFPELLCDLCSKPSPGTLGPVPFPSSFPIIHILPRSSFTPGHPQSCLAVPGCSWAPRHSLFPLSSLAGLPQREPSLLLSSFLQTQAFFYKPALSSHPPPRCPEQIQPFLGCGLICITLNTGHTDCVARL